MAIFKKLGVSIVVLAITSAIFFYMIRDKQPQTDVLRPALEMLGEQLFAMVPAGESRTSLVNRYEEFMDRVASNEVAPRDIESVAANILNLTSKDTVLSVDEALDALQVSEDSLTIYVTARVPAKVDSVMPSGIPGLVSQRQRQREELAERLIRLHDLSLQLRDFDRQMDIANEIVFVADSGVKVAMSVELPERLPPPKQEAIRRQLRDLENDRLLEWRRDMRELKRFRIEQWLEMDRMPENAHPSRHLVGRGVFRDMSRRSIDSLSVANIDSFKTLLRIHLDEMAARAHPEGPSPEIR